MNMKTSWFKTVAAALAVSLTTLGAWGAATITVDNVSRHDPWDGKVDCVYTLSDLGWWEAYTYKVVFTLSARQGDTIVRKSVTTDVPNVALLDGGTYTNTFDCTDLFGARFYPHGGITAELVRMAKSHDSVQLWADGPHFATCNVGAETPEACGAYFWWGDTVGYTNTGNAWISVKDGATAIQFGNTAPANSTCGKTDMRLWELGYCDDDEGYLNAAHDAATENWGAPWRMPTYYELGKLVEKSVCTSVWTTVGGVSGRKFFGVTAGYEGTSIFLPASGCGTDSGYAYLGVRSRAWSSTSNSDSKTKYQNAWRIGVTSTAFSMDKDSRFYGFPVRPVRDAQANADETVSVAAGGWSAADARSVKDTTWEGGVIVGGETNLVLKCSTSAWGATSGGAGVTITYSHATAGIAGTIAEATTAKTVPWTPPDVGGLYNLTHQVVDAQGNPVGTPLTAVFDVYVPPVARDYLTFTAEEANSSVTFTWASATYVMVNKNDAGWEAYTAGTTIPLVNVGDKVMFKGNDVKTDGINHFSMTGKIAASGDVGTLTDGKGGAGVTLGSGCYSHMFYQCASLTEPLVLPATTLAEGCYSNMFSGCTSMVVNKEAPGKVWSIPAGATEADGWGDSMFLDTAGDLNGLDAPEIGRTYYIGAKKEVVGDVTLWSYGDTTRIAGVSELTKASADAIKDKGITNLIVGSDVTRIGDYAFHYWRSLRDVTIAENCVSVGKCAFLKCHNITNLACQATADREITFGNNVFAGCNSLETMSFAAMPTDWGDTPFLFYSGIYMKDGIPEVYMMPTVTITGYTQVLKGSNDLTTWENVTDETKKDYHFFKIVLEEEAPCVPEG